LTRVRDEVRGAWQTAPFMHSFAKAVRRATARIPAVVHRMHIPDDDVLIHIFITEQMTSRRA
jgi:hypothetical protein